MPEKKKSTLKELLDLMTEGESKKTLSKGTDDPIKKKFIEHCEKRDTAAKKMLDKLGIKETTSFEEAKKLLLKPTIETPAMPATDAVMVRSLVYLRFHQLLLDSELNRPLVGNKTYWQCGCKQHTEHAGSEMDLPGYVKGRSKYGFEVCETHRKIIRIATLVASKSLKPESRSVITLTTKKSSCGPDECEIYPDVVLDEDDNEVKGWVVVTQGNSEIITDVEEHKLLLSLTKVWEEKKATESKPHTDDDRFEILPTEAEFLLKRSDSDPGIIELVVFDKIEHDNDSIRNIKFDDFELFWDNSSECMFDTTKFASVEDAEKWCLSIGMTKYEE